MANEKLQPRNQTARRATARAAGNPVIVEMESGVGNCFPGLELDLRNLERRFFPFLTVDFVNNRMEIVAVDVAALQAALPIGPLRGAYEQIAGELAQMSWRVERITADFAG